MIDSNMLVNIISIIVTIISIVVAIITMYDRKRIKDGVKSASDAFELELKRTENKTQLEQQKLELERKKHEAREKWKNFEAGLKFIDLLSRLE